MKLQLKSYGKKYTVETKNDDLNIQEYFDLFIGLLVQAKFEPKTIEKYLCDLSDEISHI